MNRQTKQLKPCPFCGCISVKLELMNEYEDKPIYAVQCQDCSSCGPYSLFKSIALNAWQKRHEVKDEIPTTS